MNQPTSAAMCPPPATDLAAAALFLDFDGTLAPIAPRPNLAAMSEPTRAMLVRLLRRTEGALAILSGRALADLDRMLAPLVLPAAGSHGLERRSLAGVTQRIVASGAVAEASQAMIAFGGAHGLLVERKPAGAALHYRDRPDLEAACRAFADRAAARPGLRTVHGDMIAEVSLAAADKGSALAAFMAEPPFRGRMPIVAGDDVTDEDAFRAARSMGGLAIKIGPGATAATHRAASIEDFLNWLAETAGHD